MRLRRNNGGFAGGRFGDLRYSLHVMRPKGVTLIGCFCLMAGVYLCSISTILLFVPAATPGLRRVPLLLAIRYANPYVTIGVGVAWASVGWGLFQLHDWARWSAQILFAVGITVGVPHLMASHHSTWTLVVAWVEIVARTVAVFYLFKETVIDAFLKRKSERAQLASLGTPH